MIAVKTIKFDLPIDGIKVKNLDELREHFTVEVLDLYNNGLLLKWMCSRQMRDELNQLEQKASTELSRMALMKVLCEVFGVDADDMIIAAALGMPPKKMEKNFSEIKAQYRMIAHEEITANQNAKENDEQYLDLKYEISQLQDKLDNKSLICDLNLTKWSLLSTRMLSLLSETSSRLSFMDINDEDLEDIIDELELDESIQEFSAKIEELNNSSNNL